MKVLGVKFIVGDFYLLECLKKVYLNYLIWVGFDEMMLLVVLFGVDGVIGLIFNVNGVCVC